MKLGSYSEEPLTGMGEDSPLSFSLLMYELEVLSNERLYLWDKKLIYVFKRGTGDQLFCHGKSNSFGDDSSQLLLVRSREDLGKFEPLVGPFATGCLNIRTHSECP